MLRLAWNSLSLFLCVCVCVCIYKYIHQADLELRDVYTSASRVLALKVRASAPGLVRSFIIPSRLRMELNCPSAFITYRKSWLLSVALDKPGNDGATALIPALIRPRQEDGSKFEGS